MNWIESHIKTLTALSGMPDELARKLFLRRVRVELEPHVRENATYRLAYATAINVIARIFPNVSFVPIDASSTAITPWGSFSPQSTDAGDPDAVLRVGASASGRRWDVGLIVHDWKVGINGQQAASSAEDWNPILAIIGACYAASAVTNLLLEGAITGASSWPEFSILDFAAGTADFDFLAPLPIGEIHVAGVGAVGSAFLFCLLAHGRCQGTLHLVDRDVIDSTNLGRYPLFDLHDVGADKVGAAKRRLDALGGLDVLAHQEQLQEYCRKRLAADTSFCIAGLVSAPDKRETRRQFQHELPRRLWDASTGPDQVVIHRNDYDPQFACLECTYPARPEEDSHLAHVAETLGISVAKLKQDHAIDPQGAQLIATRYPHLNHMDLIDRDYDSVFRDLCSASILRAGDEVVLAPTSFTSLLAGAFLYLEFVKSFSPERFAHLAATNYYSLDPHFPPNPYLRELRRSRAGCTCQQPAFRNAYASLWGTHPCG